jgi:hypothetical protein
VADAARRPGSDHVAGQQGEDRGDVGDKSRRVKDKVGGSGVLLLLAIDLAAQVKPLAPLDRGIVRRDQDGAKWGGGFEGLALQPLRRPVLPVPRGDVVEYRVPGDRRGRLRSADMPGAGAPLPSGGASSSGRIGS